MKPISEIRDELLAHAVEYCEDAALQADEYIRERARKADNLITGADIENRQLLAAEQRQVERLTADMEALTRLRDTLMAKAVEQRQAELAEFARRSDLAAQRRGAASGATGNAARDTVMRHAESQSVRLPDSLREAVVATVERASSTGPDGAGITDWLAVTAHPDYLGAFAKLLRDPQRGHMTWTPGEQQAFANVQARAGMVEGSGSAGGYMVPAFLDPAIMITGTGTINPVRRLATVRQIASPTWKGITADQVLAAWGDELTEVSDVSPTLAQPSADLMSGKAFISASFEFLDDVADFATECARLFADARNNLEAAAFYNGNGTSAPQGLWSTVTATTACRVESTTAAQVGIVDLMAVQNALKPRYSAGASWLSSIAQINRTRSLAMSQTGAGLWQDLGADTPATFLGRGYYEWANAPATATTGDYPVLYGNVAAGYAIVDHVGGSRVELLPQLFGSTNGLPIAARGFLLYWRTGAVVTNADAFRVLKVR